MATFTPKSSPLYGGDPLTIQLENELQFNLSLPFFVVFEGSRRRHIVSAHYSNPNGLFCTHIPGHDRAEEVQVTLVQLSNETGGGGDGGGSYSPLVRSYLNYECDTTVYLAKFLTSSVYNDHALDNLELIKSDHFDLSNEVLSTLDVRLNLALHNAELSPSWHLLGGDSLSDAVCEERETLLHFCARLGLVQVALFLLEQPGSEDALQLRNRHGELPSNIARQNGFHELAEMLSGYNMQGMHQSHHPEVVEIEHGVVRILHDSASITSFVENPNMDRSIENEIAFLIETEEMMKMQHNISQSQSYNSDWPEDLHPHLSGATTSFSTSSVEQEMEESIQRLIRKQHLHGQALQGYSSSHEHSDNIEIRRLEDDAAGLTDESYQGLERSLTGVHGLSENLFDMRERFIKHKQSKASRKKHLTRFSSSCPTLFQPVLTTLSSVPENEDENPDVHSTKETAGEAPFKLSSSMSLADPSYSDPNFDPRVHIRINGVTVGSTDTQGQEGVTLPPKAWDGTEEMELDEDTVFHYGPPGSPKDVGEDVQSVRMNRKSLSLTNLDEDDDEEDDEEFHLRIDSPKKQSLEETPTSRSPLFHSLSLTPDTHGGESDSVSPGSSPHNEGSMMSGRGLSPYNAKSLQDLASPEVNKELSILSTGPIARHHRFENPGNMTKSLSTPSIPYAIEHGGDPIREKREGKHQDERAYRKFLEDCDLFRRQKEIEEIEEEDLPAGEKKDFLSEEHSPNDSDEKSGKTGRKEEKRRKPSMFSRFQSSYRTKKSKGKEIKNKEGHNFVAVSFSNSTACDFCHKPVANKAALRCQTCMVNVHESGCKDQITCDKRSSLKNLNTDALNFIAHGDIPSQFSWTDQPPLANEPQMTASHVRTSSNPAKDRRNCASVHVKTQSVPPPIPPTHRHSLPTSSLFGSGSPPDSPLGVAQWSAQNVNRFSLYDKAISEEIECETVIPSESSNIAETSAESWESLDIDALVEVPELHLLREEPEAWSITVDKRTLKKLSTKDIKRQDTIWELVETEKQYVKRLRIMQKIFADKMVNELNYSHEQADRLFPRLDDLVDLHIDFLRELQALQDQSEDRYVEEIGMALVSQFTDGPAEKMKSVYGVFCSRHTEAMQHYKEFFKVDRKFQNFARKCNYLSICEKRDISDFILGVTVRLSKYPILIEAILKSTKDKKDRESLSQALQHSKDVVQHIDEKVAAYEKLMDIQNKLESRAVMYRGKKFKRQDLNSDGRELIHCGKLGWKTTRGRVYDVLAVVLTDVIVILQKSEQKFAFFMQDNKCCIIPLYRLLLREKNDEKDSIGIYMISQTPQKNSAPEMYEFICHSRTERENWIHLLHDAIRACPPERETEPTTPRTAVPNEEERRKEEESTNQINKIIEKLHQQDFRIKECCDEKNRLIQELMGVSSSDTDNRHPQGVHESSTDVESMDIMQAALEEASRLTTILHGSESHLSRSVSSVGEHVSDSYVVTAMPRRAETFAGFDTSYESQSSEMSAIKSQLPASQTGNQEEERTLMANVSVDEGTSSLSDNSFSMQDLSRTSSEPQPLRTSPSPPKQVVSSVLTRQLHTSLDSASNTGSLTELSTSSMVPSTGGGSTSGEHMTSIASLVQHLNALMKVTCKQNTKVESLQAELEEAKRQIAKLSADMHGRRTTYGHDQLEELRNLQENINRERQEWERTKSLDRASLAKERDKLEAEKQGLEKDKSDLQNKREVFKQEKEFLQRQIDMMRAQGYHISSNIVEDKSQQLQDSGGSHAKHDNKKPPPPSHNQDSKKFVSHQRSASADLSFTAASKDGENLPHHHRQSSDVHPGGGGGPTNAGQYRTPRLSVGNLNQAKQALPMHLLSARNEQRMGGVNVQHLPFKLAGANNSSSGGGGGSNGGGGATGSSGSTSLQHHQSSTSPAYNTHQAGSGGRSGSTDIKRVQSMSASPRSATGRGNHQRGSRSVSGTAGSTGAPAPSDLSGLMKLADPKNKSGHAGSSSGVSSHKGSSSSSASNNSGSTGKSKSGSKDGIIFF